MCLSGQLWTGTGNSCLPCPVNTYNSAPGYNLYCAPCSTACYPHSHMWYACNGTHDMTCGCDEGYAFRSMVSKFCVRMKTNLSKVLKNFTENIFGHSTTLPWEQEAADFNDSTANTSSTTDPLPWVQGWAYISPLAWSIIGSLVLLLLLTWTVPYIKKKLCDKHQQPNAARVPYAEEGFIGAQQRFQEEKRHLIWEHQENPNFSVIGASNGPPQFSNGGSEQEGIPENDRNVDSPASVRLTSKDRVGESLLVKAKPPPSSLCALEPPFYSSLNLKEDAEDLPTPNTEVAEGASYSTDEGQIG